LQEGRMKKQERKQNFGIGKALLFVIAVISILYKKKD